eukprot:7294474-Prymnesium_polylepis.1
MIFHASGVTSTRAAGLSIVAASTAETLAAESPVATRAEVRTSSVLALRTVLSASGSVAGAVGLHSSEMRVDTSCFASLETPRSARSVAAERGSGWRTAWWRTSTMPMKTSSGRAASDVVTGRLWRHIGRRALLEGSAAAVEA